MAVFSVMTAMLKEPASRQCTLGWLSSRTSFCVDHLLRKNEQYVDFSFIWDKVRHCTAITKSPSVDPVLLFKMLFIGYLFDMRSERQLVHEVQANVGYCLFLGLRLQ
jgi:transposase